MALEDFYEDFIFMDYVSVSDGLGGIRYEFQEGAPFRAAIRTLNSDEVEVAYRNGLHTIYRITSGLNVVLEQNDVVMRVKDRRYYRITSDSLDNTTPDIAAVQQRHVTAEVMS